MSDRPVIAWLGTGLMGAPMAARLAQHGFAVHAWNRTPAKAEALAAAGVRPEPTAAAAMTPAGIVFTTFSDYPVTESVLTGLPLEGRILVQMATLGVEQSQRLAAQVEAAGGRYLEAPVLGSIPEAKAGTLIIMAGGRDSDFNTVRPLLAILGKEIRLIGPVGQAAALKLALNQLIATLTTAFATTQGFVQKHQVPVDTFMDILRASALYAPTFDKKLPRMLVHDYADPNFPTEHLVKDIDLFLAEAQGLEGKLPAAAAALYRQALQHHRFEDYSCVFETVTGNEP
ncbi:3-hydroxyisobutyrate dehydrogenase [Methylomarinovum caldicuralii]|uniref:3-hydroxyisobutyrate dehydrogenase n=1 Tax=Methylomarinovum caldicuralii TaxID=438856 RepID=A0AAU9CLP0_9GAMM|nr:NAD(P)-dependent oxidoreductase [Methylomarinovum caldicuralii]BCX80768.1 3-hydroxyisobutyrate dehydrogenase [Methylomarinovum caldicuralii]